MYHTTCMHFMEHTQLQVLFSFVIVDCIGTCTCAVTLTPPHPPHLHTPHTLTPTPSQRVVPRDGYSPHTHTITPRPHGIVRPLTSVLWPPVRGYWPRRDLAILCTVSIELYYSSHVLSSVEMVKESSWLQYMIVWWALICVKHLQ